MGIIIQTRSVQRANSRPSDQRGKERFLKRNFSGHYHLCLTKMFLKLILPPKILQIDRVQAYDNP